MIGETTLNSNIVGLAKVLLTGLLFLSIPGILEHIDLFPSWRKNHEENKTRTRRTHRHTR